MATTGDKKLDEAIYHRAKGDVCINKVRITSLAKLFCGLLCTCRYQYPEKLHDMLTGEPDFSGRCNFDECLEAELFVSYSNLHTMFQYHNTFM